MILLISRSAWVRLSRETGCARVVGSKKVDVYPQLIGRDRDGLSFGILVGLDRFELGKGVGG